MIVMRVLVGDRGTRDATERYTQTRFGRVDVL